jgi:type IV secretory pathway VirB10-like protein
MSDTNDAAGAVKDDKIANTDLSLLLVHQPRVNKKLIKILIASFGGVFALAIIVAYTPQNQKNREKADTDERGNIIIRRPPELTVSPEDFFPRTYEPPPGESAGFQAETAPQSGIAGAEYTTYDRRPQVEIRENPVQNPPFTGQTPLPGEAAGTTRMERRSIFYNALPVAITSLNDGRASGTPAPGVPGYQPNINLDGLGDAYASEYQKQNMNSIKQDFLENARSSRDFSSYLNNLFMPAIDPYHEIKSGSFIPITLITSIHSDLPGPIEAQVIENVYDTYSGRNILIPKGTRVHGDYSSSVAFGQERVLIAWQRMTLPDGVTVNLQGMQGVDLRGMSGLADQVDHHISDLLLAVGISTVWDIGKAAATSALSTIDFLSEINTVLTAQGSASVSSDSAVNQIVVTYANKLMNQQPTITIREGIRGNIFVSKDIILPGYGIY